MSATVSQSTAGPVPGVYTSLEELTRLQFEISGFSFLPRQPVHSILAGRHASRLRGRGLNFEEIRRYLPGDDIRTMDWHVTARTRTPHIRVYTEERERSVLLLVDQRITMFFGSVRNMKSVTAAEAAALGAWRVLAQKDRIGAIVFNDTGLAEFPPQRSRARVMQILHALVEQNRGLSIHAGIRPNPGMLNEALRHVDRLATHDFLVCIVTDGAGADEETRRLLTNLTRHNDALVALVSDPLEMDLPDAGAVVFSDGKLQLELDTSDRRIRRDFHDAFALTRSKSAHFLLQRKTPVIPLTTAESVSRQLRRRLGASA